MHKYEYHKLDISHNHYDLIGELNKLGNEGWMLCTVIDHSINNYKTSYYFKRKVIEKTIAQLASERASSKDW